MSIKIAIGVPTGGTMKSKTAFSLIETIRLNKNIEFFPIFSYGNFAAENKEKIIKIAQDNNCSHIFLVDCDMSFSPSFVEQLLTHDKDIMGVLYNYRGILPLQTTTKFFDKSGKTVTSLPEMPKEIFKVAGIGTGLILIKMSVFSSLTTPYFPMEQDERGLYTLTEDIGFCEKARDKGFDVWCDPTLTVKHIGDYEF